MNLRDGTCSEVDLGPADFIDFPTVSPKVVGRPFKFGYCARFEREPSLEAGVAIASAIRKYTFADGAGEAPKIEEHVFGSSVSGQEAIFVPRPGSGSEDSGWLLVLTFDEALSTSELRILDAQNISSAPVARIALPQRVPYGFHGTFVPL